MNFFKCPTKMFQKMFEIVFQTICFSKIQENLFSTIFKKRFRTHFGKSFGRSDKKAYESQFLLFKNVQAVRYISNEWLRQIPSSSIDNKLTYLYPDVFVKIFIPCFFKFPKSNTTLGFYKGQLAYVHLYHFLLFQIFVFYTFLSFLNMQKVGRSTT